LVQFNEEYVYEGVFGKETPSLPLNEDYWRAISVVDNIYHLMETEFHRSGRHRGKNAETDRKRTAH
jgi:hypothetical protein